MCYGDQVARDHKQMKIGLARFLFELDLWWEFSSSRIPGAFSLHLDIYKLRPSGHSHPALLIRKD